MPSKSTKIAESDDNVSLKLNDIDAKLEKLLKLQENYENLEKVILMQNSKIESLEKENSGLKERLVRLEKNSYHLNTVQASMQDHLLRTEHEKNRKKVEIKGIIADSPGDAIKSANETIEKIGKVSIKSSRISFFPKRNQPAGSYSIVAKFHSSHDAVKVLKNKKQCPSKVFINECLTKPQREIFSRCLHLKKEKKLSACYTKGGITFVKMLNSDKVYVCREYSSIPEV